MRSRWAARGAERDEHRAAAFQVALNGADGRPGEHTHVRHHQRGVIRERALADGVGARALHVQARARQRADCGGEVRDVVTAGIRADDQRARLAVLDHGEELIVLGQRVCGLQRHDHAMRAGAEIERIERGVLVGARHGLACALLAVDSDDHRAL